MPNIIVNATALRTGGALSILNQFLEYASGSNNYFVIFVYPGLKLKQSTNFEFVEVNKISWLKRIFWDAYGINKWIKKDSRTFNLVISLQNTSIKTKLKQVIYLHQSLPYYKHKWNFLKRSEIKLFLYKNFYKFFIYLFIKSKDIIIVQSNWLKELIESEGRNIKVVIFRPSVDRFETADKSNYDLNPILLEKKFLLYPSSTNSYKNHLFLIDVVNELRDIDFILVVTFKEGEYLEFDHKINLLRLKNKVFYSGYLSRSELAFFYKMSYALVFPSEIETFGLPLIEAAGLGKKIICSDLPYSRDVINSYEGSEFVMNKDLNGWSNAFRSTLISPIMSYPRYMQTSNSWNEFFNFIDGVIYVQE